MGKKNYWAILGKDRGDCVNYATAKYFTLKQLRVPTNKMYLSYVKATKQTELGKEVPSGVTKNKR